MNLGIAFSGGGFRATLFHLGVVRYLRDEGRLVDVTHICSVSGGSVLAAHLVQNWDRYTGTKEEFEEAASGVIKLVRSDVRGRILRRFLTCWPTLLLREGGRFDSWRVPANRLLERYYSRELFTDGTDDVSQGTLTELSPAVAARPYCHILATNLSYGTISAFAAEGYSYEVERGAPIPYEAPSAPIALAVAASSAYPSLFSPIRLSRERLRRQDGYLQDEPHLLTDGGVYDNLGVRHFRGVLESRSCFPMLRTHDLVDVPGILGGLLSGDGPHGPMPFARMWNELAPNFRKEVGRARDGEAKTAERVLTGALNQLIHREELYDPDGWNGIALAPEVQSLIRAFGETDARYDLFLRNRLLLESAFPRMIAGCLGQGMKVIVSDAGRSFNRIKEIEFSDFILATALRASDVLMNRIEQLERDESQDDGRFLFIDINDMVDNVADATAPADPIQRAVSQIRTDLDAFSDPEISGLVRHGYCVARREFAPLLTRPSTCQFEPPWDPVRPPGHDYKATDASDLRVLDASKYRRKGLFSTRDWISYLHLGLLALLVVGGWSLWGLTTRFVGNLALTHLAHLTFTDYKNPSLTSWEVIDPYYVDDDRYREADRIAEPEFRGFTIASDDRLFDLQNWRPAKQGLGVAAQDDARFQDWVDRWRRTPQDERDRLLRSSGEPAFLTREIRLSKKKDEDVPQGVRNDEIRVQFLTEGFGIAPRLDTSDPRRKYGWYVERSKTLGSVGPRATKKWNLVVQLPDEKPGERIDLRIEAIFWNGFQDRVREWASIKLNGPTAEASVWILFPEAKPYKTYELQQYVVGQPASARIPKAMPVTNPKKTKLFWTLGLNPDHQQIYEVKWTW